MKYAPSQHWNRYHQGLLRSGRDLDWGAQWTGAFIKPLQEAGCQDVLDLGCGTGNEVLGLTREGFEATGVDFSITAIQKASTKAQEEASFAVVNMAQALPFQTASFDAVMSNVAAHMFSDAITRKLFREIRRILRRSGLFLFHLNALEDRPFRAQYKPQVEELEANYILEENGQTMHFFSKDYLLDLFTGWGKNKFELVEIPKDIERGFPTKWVWRGIVVQ